MKRIHLLVLAIISLSSCSQETRFSISTNQNEDTNLIYTTPLAGTFNYMSTDTVRVFAGGGKTLFKSEYSDPTPVYLRTEDGRSTYIIAEGGSEYELRLGADRIDIIGNSAQNLYNSIYNPDYIIDEAKKYSSNSSAKHLIEITKSRKASETKGFNELRQRAEVSKDVCEYVKLERDIFWRAVRGNVAYLHFTEKGMLDAEDKKIWQSAFEGLKLNDKNLCNTRWYFDLAESYVEYCLFSAPDFDMEQLLKQAGEGKLNTIYYELYTENFKGKNLEYLCARKIYNAAIQRNFEKELTEIYSDFCKRFPESAYRRILDPMIQEIEEFHETTRSNEKVIILDNYLNINSFEELLSRFQGKKIYIDVWATWCGPCKDEFRHNEKLRKLLGEAGYELLYISIDDDKRARTWEQMIYASELEGYHIRAGAELYNQLFEIYGSQRLSIPWYMTVDENGVITDNHAPRPGRLKAENLK